MAAQEAEERREARRQDAQDEEAILVESSAFGSSSSSALSTALSTTTNRAPDGDDPTTFTPTTTKNLKQQKSKRGGQQKGENSEDASDAESSEEAESSSKRQKTATKNLKLDSLIVSAEEVRTKRGKLVNNVPSSKDGNDDDQDDQGGEGENDEVGGKTMGDFDFSGADMQRYLREAFLDDDVVADFLKEKKEEEKADKTDSNSVSAYLPGWGNWAGGGIAENRRKRARLVKRTVTRERRIGAQIANAIVLKETEVDEVARRYKVRKL